MNVGFQHGAGEPGLEHAQHMPGVDLSACDSDFIGNESPRVY